MELTTTYLGLRLRNPLVASPSPLSYTLDGIRRLADASVGAIVMFSLFEEQLRERAAETAKLVDGPAESFPEALDYVPWIVKEDAGPRDHLRLLERAAASVDVPVLASLNGVTPEGWTEHARAMQDAGGRRARRGVGARPAAARRRAARRAATPSARSGSGCRRCRRTRRWSPGPCRPAPA